MLRCRICSAFAAMAVWTATSSIYGGDVKYVAQENDAAHFRSTAAKKPHDSDGAYGSAGYVLYTTDENPGTHGTVFAETDPLSFDSDGFRTIRSIPSYLTLKSNGQTWGVGGFDYPHVDDPRNAVGLEVKDIGSGLAVNNFVEIGQEASVLDLIVGSDFPVQGVRVGVMAFGRGKDAMSHIRLSQTGGRGKGTAEASLVGNPNVYLQLFDITGAAEGDRYTVFLTKSADGENPNVAYLGLTLDTLVSSANQATTPPRTIASSSQPRMPASQSVMELVDRAIKGDPTSSAAAQNQLERMIEGDDESGREATKSLLSRRGEITADRGVAEMLDGLVKRDEAGLAAKLVLRIARAKTTVVRYRRGHVVVGRVLLADGMLDPEMVLAQTEILSEGYFAGEVGDLQRPIGFRAIGYEEFDVPLTGRSGEVICVGTVVLNPLPAEREASIKGKVSLDNSKGEGTATVMMSLSVPDANTPHGRYSPRRGWPDPIEIRVAKNGTFEAKHLTPGRYTLFAQGDGHVRNSKSVRLEPGREVDADTIALKASDLGFYVGKEAPKTGDLPWEQNFTTAAKRASDEGKPLMVMMTATWCGPCRMLEEGTLNTPWVRYFLSRFVIVKAYEDKEVEGKYGPNGYPTLVFTNPQGKEVCRTVGNQPTVEFAGVCARAYQQLGTEMPPELREMVDKKIVNPARR